MRENIKKKRWRRGDNSVERKRDVSIQRKEGGM